MATWAEDSASEKLIVAAIDFGTTYSGYAFAFKKDYTSDCQNIRIHGATFKGGLSLKAPTCVLFDEFGNFHSFGFDAENTYAELTAEDEHHEWYYFRRFKMMLYNNPSISTQSILLDDKGKSLSAMTVFSAIISYLRRQAVSKINERSIGAGFMDEEISWVLTVPAIWSDQAKKFMREAAKKAGIRSHQLDIALEPEAASIHCKHISVNKQELSDGDDCSGMESLRPGTRYMVLDAGGGTIDITVQEIQEDGTLHQVYMANGGEWGGTRVDQEYEDFLIAIVGKEIWDQFKKRHMDSYLEILRDFETKKRTITPDTKNRITFKVPVALREVYDEIHNLDSSGDIKGHYWLWKGDKLRVDAVETKRLFSSTCEAIVNHVQKVFREKDTADVSVILMVGGFSESPMLKAAVKERFSKRIIIPAETGLSVLRGAVLFGFDTKVISLRVMKHTYGIQSIRPFRKGKDPDSTKTMVKGKLFCVDRFSKHVNKGQSVNINEETEEIDYSTVEDNAQMALKVYITDRYELDYCDTDGCCYIGQLVVSLPTDKPLSERGVKVKMKFGGTELAVSAKVTATGETTHAEFCLFE